MIAYAVASLVAALVLSALTLAVDKTVMNDLAVMPLAIPVLTVLVAICTLPFLVIAKIWHGPDEMRWGYWPCIFIGGAAGFCWRITATTWAETAIFALSGAVAGAVYLAVQHRVLKGQEWTRE
jgi:hypothetical protein